MRGINIKTISLKNIKNFKRVFYKGRMTGFRRAILIMLAVGAAASLMYFIRYAYLDYAASKANIVLSYPEIAQSRYPDGSRFTYYSFISDDNVSDAIEIMQKDGKYKYFTAEDLRDSFHIYSNLENSANASVTTARSEGNDFSYVANEYRITFIQPHPYKNPNIFGKLFARDYSDEFLEALVEVNRRRIAEEAGGISGFAEMTDASGVKDYDYNEELRIYKAKIDNIMNYLNYLNGKEPDFVSDTGMSLMDLKGEYNFLISNRLDGISDYIESSGISRDVELTSNKLKVNIENNQLRLDKFIDRAAINKYAMEKYDHTFTENLINVIQNEEYGLYQARPKTEFDTVVGQKHEADENVAKYGSMVNQLKSELNIYATVSRTEDENKRLTEKCEELMAQFRKEYEDLSKSANAIITEYYNEVNENYITAKIKKESLISKALIIKLGIVFALGAALAFAAVVLVSFIDDTRKVRRKQKLLRTMKQNAWEEAE